ncbi:MAG: flagellar export protein FliJ [Anaerolineae bacterium]|nr:flagellar export protein FliJ [Anaerolineae bacterium]
MPPFRFRLQRVLDYRSRLVEAQRIEVSRCAALVARARQRLRVVRQRRHHALASIEPGCGLRVDVAGQEALWTYLGQLREEERQCQEELTQASSALSGARARLAQLKVEEQVIQKLKKRQRERADAEARRHEVKQMDDVTTSRLPLDR